MRMFFIILTGLSHALREKFPHGMMDIYRHERGVSMIDFKNAEYLKLSRVDPARAQQAVADLLIPGESVAAAFKGIRDSVIFTTHRVLSANVQGITGKKTDYTSLPYKRIQAFSVETAGVVDLDTELEIWLSGLGKVRFEFTRGTDVYALSRLIGQAIL